MLPVFHWLGKGQVQEGLSREELLDDGARNSGKVSLGCPPLLGAFAQRSGKEEADRRRAAGLEGKPDPRTLAG